MDGPAIGEIPNFPDKILRFRGTSVAHTVVVCSGLRLPQRQENTWSLIVTVEVDWVSLKRLRRGWGPCCGRGTGDADEHDLAPVQRRLAQVALLHSSTSSENQSELHDANRIFDRVDV